MNNVGSNGNYWSSSLNTSNSNNAYNLNFNSSNVNPQNNNNRYNGFSVRGVLAGKISLPLFFVYMEYYHLTKQQLLFDLYKAFDTAIIHKKNKSYVLSFKENLHENLIKLRDELWNKTYKAKRSNCFITTHPKKREIFAADFRDRIVHHLYFNYTHKIYENTFIYDTYSCIKNKGTHFGIERFKHHINQESNNYQNECYVLKMDIRGYFMNINRQLICDIATKTINKMAHHQVSKKDSRRWGEIIDIDFINYLTREIALLDPSENCRFKSPQWMWNDLPKSKTLFCTPEGCGLPIGNLTSQLFSNVFLNEFDQFVKRVLKCKHYGRYVDDFYIVSKDRDYLHKLIPQIEKFIKETLYLDINKGKTKITNVKYGVEFLGAFIKPYRTYVSNKSLARIKRQLCSETNHSSTESINSFLGILSHYKSYKIRKELFYTSNKVKPDVKGIYNNDITKFKPLNNFKII